MKSVPFPQLRLRTVNIRLNFVASSQCLVYTKRQRRRQRQVSRLSVCLFLSSQMDSMVTNVCIHTRKQRKLCHYRRCHGWVLCPFLLLTTERRICCFRCYRAKANANDNLFFDLCRCSINVNCILSKPIWKLEYIGHIVVHFHCLTPIPIPIIVPIPIVCRSDSLGPIPMVIPMQITDTSLVYLKN